MKKIIGLFFALVFSIQLQAQHDSVATDKAVPPAITLDTTLDKQKKTNDSLSLSSTEKKQRKNKEWKPNPKTAAWLSAAVPGLGQVYNRKYWKVPIVYAGLGASSFCIYYFHKEYITYRTEYRLRSNPPTDLISNNITSTPNPKLADLNTENVYSYENLNRRRMEISIIALSIFYILNIVDAAVDAHLTGFNVSDDLSLQFIPFHNNTSFYTFSHIRTDIGLTLQLNFK